MKKIKPIQIPPINPKRNIRGFRLPRMYKRRNGARKS